MVALIIVKLLVQFSIKILS